MKTSAFLAVVALALLPVSADAQQLMLHIQDGRVNLNAQNVPVRQILAEWARIGGARIVNGEKVTGAGVTLQIQGMPERQALDIILRGVSGYMLAARQTGTGVSAFDRIMILPTSSAPRPTPAPGGNAFGGNPAVNRPRPTDTMPVQAEPEVVEAEEIAPEIEDDEADVDGDGEQEEPVEDPQPEMNNRFQRRQNVFPNPMTQPGGPPAYPGQPGTEEQPDEGEPPSASNPFGIPAGASTTPGVVTPVPQQENPNAPPRRRRPPQ